MGVDEKGTVFVGGMGDFGYLTSDRSGTLHFVSLLDRLETQDQDFGQMWETLATARGVYFRSDRRLFRWSPADGIKVWRSAGGFGRSFLINDTLYVEQKGIGLQRLAGDLLELMPGSEALVSSALVCLTPDEADGLFAVSTNGQISIFRSGKIIPIAPEAAAFVQQYQARSCAALPGRVRAIGTRRGGIVLVSSEGKLDRVLTALSACRMRRFLRCIRTGRGACGWL